MAKLITRLGKGFWIINHNGKTIKRKVHRTIKGNFVIVNKRRIKVN